MGQISLEMPVQYVKGVGPARAKQLAALGIETVEDLLLYFPRRFDMRRQVQPIETLGGDEPAATVAGEVKDTSQQRFGRRPYFQCTLDDETGWVTVKWFHGGYLSDRIKTGMFLAVSGKVSVYKEAIQFINPGFQVLWEPEETDLSRDELLPVYPVAAKLTSGVIAKIVQNVLPEARSLIADWFDRPFLAKRGLLPRAKAVAAMHRPEDTEHWSQARRRMAYDECILMQLGIAMTRMRQVSRPAYPLPNSPQIDKRIRRRFPFKLTDAQDRAVAEIAADLGRDRPTNRLLQGDVGSGKTVVA
ncbi:MAG: OB-fold nucleic acid binding domain-containing protein, partial [Planctomycetota bacterium]|nr:OB-fold nucleic acid binding domain-containing protein [Planctomycetota bacterium]